MGLETMLALGLAGATTATVGSTVANVLTNKSNRDTQFEQNQALMHQQSDLNQANWEKQFAMVNEYNDPSNQLARMQAAGLNPLFGDNAGNSSASPSAGTASLASVQPMEGVDYAGAMNSMLQNIMQMFSLRSQTDLNASQVRKNDADVDYKGKDIVNKTRQTNSELAVNNAKIQELLSQSELNDEQKAFVTQQTAANKEQVAQRWKELELMSETVGARLREVANQEYTSRWQEAVGKANAYSNQVQSQSSASQARTADAMFKFGVSKWSKEFGLEVAKYSKECTNDNIDRFVKLLETQTNNTFGVKWSGKYDFPSVSALCTAFVRNMDKLDEKAFSKALPAFMNAMDVLESVNFTPIQPKKKSYNPAPWIPDEM